MKHDTNKIAQLSYSETLLSNIQKKFVWHKNKIGEKWFKQQRDGTSRVNCLRSTHDGTFVWKADVSV